MAENPNDSEPTADVPASATSDEAAAADPRKRPSTRNSGSTDPAIDQLYSRGRLVQMPSMRGRNQDLRERLLRHIATTSFQLGRSYTEAEVNERLMAVYDDYTSLRRYLVEDGHLQRDRAGREYRLPPMALA